MLKVLIPAVGLIGLVAVAAQSAAPGSAELESMAWRVSYEGDMAKLTYGVANSDHLAVMLTCAPGDRHAVSYGDVKPAGPTLALASDGPQEVDPITGELEKRLSLADPALKSLAREGRMPVEAETGARVLKADAAERRLVGDFIAYCQTARI